jgi:hypothetical protein
VARRKGCNALEARSEFATSARAHRIPDSNTAPSHREDFASSLSSRRNFVDRLREGNRIAAGPPVQNIVTKRRQLWELARLCSGYNCVSMRISTISSGGVPALWRSRCGPIPSQPEVQAQFNAPGDTTGGGVGAAGGVAGAAAGAPSLACASSTFFCASATSCFFASIWSCSRFNFSAPSVSCE